MNLDINIRGSFVNVDVKVSSSHNPLLRRHLWCVLIKKILETCTHTGVTVAAEQPELRKVEASNSFLLQSFPIFVSSLTLSLDLYTFKVFFTLKSCYIQFVCNFWALL